MRSIILGVLILLVLAAVVGAILYLGRVSRNGSADNSADSALSNLPTIATTPSVSASPSTAPSNYKTYQGQGFKVLYPTAWGVLTCSNSQNFEFDPTGKDSKNVACDYAVKPVTIMVSSGKLNCSGDTVKLGTNSVVKSKTTGSNGDINYRWCVSVGDKSLDITHRVSSSGSRATTPTDLSALIEQMIATFQSTPQGS